MKLSITLTNGNKLDLEGTPEELSRYPLYGLLHPYPTTTPFWYPATPWPVVGPTWTITSSTTPIPNRISEYQQFVPEYAFNNQTNK